MANFQTMPDPMRFISRPPTGVAQNTGSLARSTQASVRPFVNPPAINRGLPGPPAGGAVPRQAGVGQQAPGAAAPGPAGPITPMNMPAPATAPRLTSAQHLGQESLGGVEGGLRGMIMNALGGNVVSPEQIQRMKSQVFQGARGQADTARGRMEADMLRRGLSQSGLAAELAAGIDRDALGAYTQGVQNILSQAEGQNVAGRFQAGGLAQNLLQSNRGWQQYQNQLADAQARANAAAANANRNRTFTFVDPDTGGVFELPTNLF